MTDHLTHAADRAVELAEEMCGDHGRERPWPGDRAIGAHLTYMAGLLRGVAVHEPKNTIGHEIRIEGHLDDAAVQRFAAEWRKLQQEDNPFRGFARDNAKRVIEEASSQYDELAKAACAAAGIVWPATHRGLLGALQSATDGLKAWEDSWKAAMAERDKARAEREELRAAVRQLLESRWDVPASPASTTGPIGSSVVRPELLDRLAELVKP